MTREELVRDIADRMFDEDTGNCRMLVDEFNDSEHYNSGRTRGHEDAFWVLHGIADSLEGAYND